MNYDRPRQNQIDKSWKYTTARDDMVRVVGYCVGLAHAEKLQQFIADDFNRAAKLVPGSDLKQPDPVIFAEKYHDDGHATAEEAADCMRQYLLDNKSKKIEMGSKERCVECDKWTRWMVEIGTTTAPGPHAAFRLCKKHFDVASKLFNVHTDTVVHS